MISNDFEENRREFLFDTLDRFLSETHAKMTKATYLQMCEQLGEEPDPEKMPPDFTDFPYYVHRAFDLFNALPDTYSGGMDTIYVGKDFSAINSLFDIYNVEDRRKVFEVILHLDSRARDKAIQDAKAAQKKR